MFIDIHNHVIPYVDDGSKNEECTLEMLKKAEAEGISQIIATPHFIPGYNNYNNDNLLANYNLTKEIIYKNNINIKLHLGNELFIDIDSLPCLANKSCKTLAGSDYVLIEFSNRWNNDIISNLLYNIELKGYKIIMAHIERYDYFKEYPEVLKKYLQKGYYAHVNTSSIGSKNRTKRKYVDKLIKNNYVHFVATDAHSFRGSRLNMQQAYNYVKSLIGERSNELFFSNGLKVIENKEIEIYELKEKKKFRLFGGRG